VPWTYMACRRNQKARVACLFDRLPSGFVALKK
jgi:hypothetical protein